MEAVEALRAFASVACNDLHRSHTEDLVTFLGVWLATPLP